MHNPKVEERMGWRNKAKILRSTFALPSDYRPGTTNPGVQLLGVRCDDHRALEILDIAFAVACKSKPGLPFEQVAKGLWAKPSQDIERKPWSAHGPPALATTTLCVP